MSLYETIPFFKLLDGLQEMFYTVNILNLRR